MLLWLDEFPEGNPSRNEANALPLRELPVVSPSEDVVSLANWKNPAPLPGIVVSTPILRKSAPALNVWLPTNFEYVPFALTDFQLISVGLMAPIVCPSLL